MGAWGDWKKRGGRDGGTEGRGAELGLGGQGGVWGGWRAAGLEGRGGGGGDEGWGFPWLGHCPQPVLGRSGLPQGPSEEKVAVVTVDDCDTGMALRFGPRLGNYSCAAQGTQSGSKK